MLCSARRLHDHTPGTLHRAALCITLGMLAQLRLAGRAVLTSESLPAVVATRTIRASRQKPDAAKWPSMSELKISGLEASLWANQWIGSSVDSVSGITYRKSKKR